MNWVQQLACLAQLCANMGSNSIMRLSPAWVLLRQVWAHPIPAWVSLRLVWDFPRLAWDSHQGQWELLGFLRLVWGIPRLVWGFLRLVWDFLKQVWDSHPLVLPGIPHQWGRPLMFNPKQEQPPPPEQPAPRPSPCDEAEWQERGPWKRWWSQENCQTTPVDVIWRQRKLACFLHQIWKVC